MDAPAPVYAPPRAPNTVYHGEATMFAPAKPVLVVPDGNPAAATVKRLRERTAAYAADPARQLVNRDYTGAKNPDLLISRIVELEAAVDTLTNQINAIIYGLENATGVLTCDDPGPGGTITLTFPEPT